MAAIKRQLDDHDEAILALLREDGRMPFREMAQRLGLAEATIRSRLRRLESAKVMRVVARVDLKASGYPFTALVGLKIRGRSVDAVAEDLLAIPEIISILVVIGRADLEIQITARSMEMLNELLNARIAAIDGVVELDTALAMDIVKYVQPWGSFE